MCGIYGILSRRALSDKTYNRDQLFHRGPDDAGIWFNASKTAILAHRRLSIIDLSENSRQPFVSEDGRYIIVFNGEIYNYKEIRYELEQLGHNFLSDGDTEVLLGAYCEWGEKCVDRFNGMFAFAIMDTGDN